MKKIIQFIIITYLFSWSLWGLQYLGQEGMLPEWVQLFGMFALFGPLVGLLFMLKIEKKSYKEVFKRMFSKTSYKLILFAMISPMVLSGLAYIVYRYYAVTDIEPIGVTLISVIPLAIIMLFTSGPIEEFGWRGYLLPKIRSNYSIVLSIFFMGLVHGLWHLPLHFLNGTVQEALPIYEYLIITIAITVSYVFIYEFTSSLIPMIILHWFANLSNPIFPYFYNVQGRYALLILFVILDVVLLIMLSKKTSLISDLKEETI